MRVRRPLIAAGMALALAAALLAPGSAGATKKPGLTFEKPVALNSFSPVRTAVGTVYNAEDGQQGSDHEWSGEPSIQIDDKGTIYIAGTCCVVASSPLWYSKDDGKTFVEMESPGHAREFGVGAEGDLAVDHEGHVWFVDTYVPGLLMSRWADNGDSWEFTTPTAGVAPGMNDRPWLAWSEDAIYLYVNYAIFTQVYKSTDGGLTWQANAPNTWEGSTSGQPFFPGHVAADEKKGTMWLTGVVPDGNSALGQLGSHVSTDGGATFKEALVSKPQRRGGFSPIFTGSVAVDAAGTGYTTWSTFDKEGCDVYYASSTNLGKSWSKPVKVNRSRGCATFPWITAGDDGKVALVWYQTPTTTTAPPSENQEQQLSNMDVNQSDLSKAPLLAFQDEVDDKAPWYVHAAAITDATAAKPKIYEGQVPTKTPIMSGPLNRELWDFFQVDITDDGRIIIAFVSKFHDTAPQTWFVKTASGPRLK